MKTMKMMKLRKMKILLAYMPFVQNLVTTRNTDSEFRPFRYLHLIVHPEGAEQDSCGKTTFQGENLHFFVQIPSWVRSLGGQE